MKRLGRMAWGFLLILTVSMGCAGRVPDPDQRTLQAKKNFPPGSLIKEQVYIANHFNILSWRSFSGQCSGKIIHIYIEGDGLAWLTSSIPSDNPTPLNPTGLKLFLADPEVCKLYLARPGQYAQGQVPDRMYWTSHRFSSEVIRAYGAILDEIKIEYSPDSFVLFGYSGGGAVAAILAAQRSDISGLVTVAGNLDTDKWTGLHSLTPLTGSLNPADFASDLETIPQIHLIGGKDHNMDAAVFFSFRARCSSPGTIRYKIYDQFDHGCCWDRAWPGILSDIGYGL